MLTSILGSWGKKEGTGREGEKWRGEGANNDRKRDKQ